MQKTLVSPSLLACDFLNIESELKVLNQIPDIWYHLDIMDGHFVPNLTFGHPIIEKISKKSLHPLDAHFMVNNPEFYIETMKDMGLHNITLHLESFKNKSQCLSALERAKTLYPSIGISVRPRTNISQLDLEILKLVDLVLIMSVEPGFGGQSFIESSYEKIQSLYQVKMTSSFTFQIQIDGGVSDLNSHQLIKSGASNLVAGSYIFKQGKNKYKDAIDSLRRTL